MDEIAALAPPRQAQVARILKAALKAVDPYAAVQQALRREGDTLFAGGQAVDLRRYRQAFIVGAGKAGAPMALATVETLEGVLKGGVVIVKEGYAALPGEERKLGPVRLLEAGHPIPDERGVRAAQALAELLASAGPDDLVLALISGGGSALLVAPVPGVTLAELQALTSALLASGATIQEINTLRKHLDGLKGGGLARQAGQARLITLILSDVVGDPLDVIASGPTVPDPTTFAGALDVLQRYKLADRAPAPVRDHLQRGLDGEIPETLKPGDPRFERVQNILVGSNRQAAEAASLQAQAEGFRTALLTTSLQGEARQAGGFLAAILGEMALHNQPLPRPACLVAGGETTVTLHGKGLGGRNQELALSSVASLAGLADIALVALATDGGDGPTDAAGAVVTGETLARAQALGLDPLRALADNDAYHFFEPLGDLLKTGPTQTNVNDLDFLFTF